MSAHPAGSSPSGPSGAGEMVLELPGVYPNGIAFDAQQRLYWTESMAHRVRRLAGGERRSRSASCPTLTCPTAWPLPPTGALFVATTVSGGVTVVSPDGAVLEEIHLGEHATNCIFDGADLYVTATRAADIEALAADRDVSGGSRPTPPAWSSSPAASSRAA